MRKPLFAFLIILLLIFSRSANAQFVTIPDSNFVLWLNANGYATCMSGNLMDTTCTIITQANTLSKYPDSAWTEVTNLDGIQYFDSITILYWTNGSINTIPAFPALLEKIYLSGNAITVFPDFPAQLQYLNIGYNGISYLPTMPPLLEDLLCFDSTLDSLPPLPASLRRLYCGGNNSAFYFPPLPDLMRNFYCLNTKITALPDLPDSLEILSVVYDSNLTSLPLLPSNLKHLACIGNLLLTTLPSLPNSLEELHCYSSSFNALPVLPNGLKALRCFNNQITVIPNFPDSLDYIHAQENLLTSIPPIPSKLRVLSVGNNLLDSLPSLPQSITNLGCDFNQLTSLPDLPVSLEYFNCSYNQLTSIPYTEWDTGPHSYFNYSYNDLINIGSLPKNISNLYLNMNYNLACLPQFDSIMYLQWSGTNISCLPNAGYINVVYPSIANLPLCQPASGCDYYWNISGSAFNDVNTNCLIDSSESKMKNIPVKLDSGGANLQIFLTNEHGDYSFETGLGNFNVSIDTADLPFTINCPPSQFYNANLTTIDSVEADLNFGIECKPGYIDLITNSISPSAPLRPGQFRTLYLNAGDASLFYGVTCATGVSGSVVAVLDSMVSYVSPAAGGLPPATINGDTVTWVINDFSLVDPQLAFNLVISVDTFAVTAIPAHFELIVISDNGDTIPSNNILVVDFPIVNSFDPNAKEMFPAGILDSLAKEFIFTIFFQNTGTAPAEHIYLIDTLDVDLNASTFKFLSSSHEVVTQLLPNRILRFSFPNINLPDSNSNEPGSHGYVQFKMSRNDSAYSNMTISNIAYIYFDLNPPVVTNEVFSILNPDCNSVLSLLVNDTTVCEGELISAMNDVALSSYISHSWSLDSVFFSGNASVNFILPAGIHTITLTADVLDCHVSSSQTITVYALPVPSFTVFNDSLISDSTYSNYQWLCNEIAIPSATQNYCIISQDGWYVLAVTDSNGCIGLSDSAYYFNCSNLLSLNISDSAICKDQVIVANNPSYQSDLNYSWMLDSVFVSNDSSVILSGLTVGIHMLSLNIDTLNCSIALQQLISVYDVPQPGFTVSNNMLTSDSMYSSYQWLVNNTIIPGSNQLSTIITQSGFYTLQVTDSNGCIGVSDSVFVSGMGIDEQSGSTFYMYPNPAGDVLNLMLKDQTPLSLNVNILDITGRHLKTVYDEKFNGTQIHFTISLESLNGGIYLLQVNNSVRYFIKR